MTAIAVAATVLCNALMCSPGRGECGGDRRGDYLDAIHTEEADPLQHRAAAAMHHAWVVLVNQQPHRSRTPRGLS